MAKRVVVIASGRTEREALPHLTKHFGEIGYKFDIRIPPRNRPLIPNIATLLVKAAWWELSGRGEVPNKFVVLVDADGRSPAERLLPFKEACSKLKDIAAPILATAAQWHLEAWFFGHAEALREFLGRDLGNVDASAPDSITNPKLHLRHLLGDVYHSRLAGEIASRLSASVIRDRSPSFASFEEAVRNGSVVTP